MGEWYFRMCQYWFFCLPKGSGNNERQMQVSYNLKIQARFAVHDRHTLVQLVFSKIIMIPPTATFFEGFVWAGKSF